MIFSDGVCDLLQQHSLSCLGLGYDHTPLSFSDRSKKVEYPGRHVVRCRTQLDHFIGKQRSEILKGNAVTYFVGGLAINRFHAKQRKIFFTFFWRSDLATNRVAGLQSEKLYLRG